MRNLMKLWRFKKIMLFWQNIYKECSAKCKQQQFSLFYFYRMKNKVLIFILSLLACYAAAFIGSFATIDSITGWYTTIVKPSFNPPNWIFGPVWSLLYTLMGICFYLINISENPSKDFVRKLFIVQLILNAFWSILFFNFHALGFAIVDILLLLFVLILIAIKGKEISIWCSILFIPYILWVSFATILNISIWWLNA